MLKIYYGDIDNTVPDATDTHNINGVCGSIDGAGAYSPLKRPART